MSEKIERELRRIQESVMFMSLEEIGFVAAHGLHDAALVRKMRDSIEATRRWQVAMLSSLDKYPRQPGAETFWADFDVLWEASPDKRFLHRARALRDIGDRMKAEVYAARLQGLPETEGKWLAINAIDLQAWESISGAAKEIGFDVKKLPSYCEEDE